ncbi:MAG: succinate dehydrogenase, cytochrome b556 subunit [Defluviicoccus sp.]|nr:succinate dehydrogenase, cytochrome b556 subunit [Defluviicoccus sp.]MDE0384475.1 succinate dehydrogenase, cytochrome b556 subunit [Defluviicoccus sp.]
MSNRDRPLSPHLQVYRPQITSVLSIAHRASGVVLAAGLVLLLWWLAAAASGGDAFATVQEAAGSFLGRLFLFGWTFALFYHLCNGIRHLFWDMGRGFELATVSLTGWLALGGAALLTGLSWVLAYAAMGAFR